MKKPREKFVPPPGRQPVTPTGGKRRDHTGRKCHNPRLGHKQGALLKKDLRTTRKMQEELEKVENITRSLEKDRRITKRMLRERYSSTK